MRSLSVMLAVCLCGSCAAERGASLQIQNVPVPNESCEYTVASDKYTSSGFYDPHGYGNHVPAAYRLALLLRNNMIAAEDDPATSFDRDIRASANDVEVIGFNVCWDLASHHETYGNEGELPVECDALPADQKSFVATSAWIGSGGGQVTLGLDVLTLAHLQAAGIFGAGFLPYAIPEQPRYETTEAQPAFSLPLDGATSGSRSAYWGDFPFDPSSRARLILVVQAVARTQSGDGIRSNWFLFPVDVCVGCLTYACGVPVYTECTSGPEPTTAYVGGYIDMTKTCLPFQNTRPECLELSCP